MQFVFSEDNKFKTWRKLWISLAKAEQRQGLADHRRADRGAGGARRTTSIMPTRRAAGEKETRHDVMSHVYAYGLQCPNGQADHPPGRDQLLRG